MRISSVMKIRRPLVLLITSLLARGDTTNSEKEVQCIPCDVLFSKLQETSSSKNFQMTPMQLRGEPKSGTAMMYEWAEGSLYQACEFFKKMFGETTCHVTWEAEDPQFPDKSNCVLEFQPSRGNDDAPCSCQHVDSVLISVSRLWKHELPVSSKCDWYHRKGIAPLLDGGSVVPTMGGKLVGNYSDALRYMTEANCTITDDRLQLVVMRDPRPVAVSTFYHQRRYGHLAGEELKEYVLKTLPTICMWVSLRYFLFKGTMSDRSTIFWYHEAVANPLDWHQRFFHSIGLQLPSNVVKSTTDAALRKQFPFKYKGIERHSEGPGQEVMAGRSWEDEVGVEIVQAMNKVVRLQLPPVLLAKLSVPFV